MFTRKNCKQLFILGNEIELFINDISYNIYIYIIKQKTHLT